MAGDLRSKPRAPAPEGDFAIETRNLGKMYEARNASVRAVTGLDVKIRRGEIFGLLGPNGAGKTTTLRMLCGLLAPTEGEAFVDGVSMASEPVKARRRIGLVPGEAGNLDILTASEELAYYGAFYGLDARTVEARSAPLLERLGLSDRRRQRVGTFSKGMRRKLHLIRALLHEPTILILDEPTSGLDPSVVEEVWEILLTLSRERDVTVLFASHQLEEVERLCSRVAILQVRLLAEGALDELSDRPPAYRVGLAGEAGRFLGALDGLAGVSNPRAEGETLRFNVEASSLRSVVPAVVRRLVTEGADVLDVSAEEEDLRSLYRSIVRQEAGKEGGP